jgi:hypothetical protein
MVPAKQDIRIMRGDTEVFNIALTDSANAPINLTGDVFTSQIRYNRDDSSIAATFTCVVTDAAAGLVTLTLSPVSSALLNAGVAYWDLQRNDSGVITTLVAGKCTILADVTR